MRHAGDDRIQSLLDDLRALCVGSYADEIADDHLGFILI